ncbi:hypothetical protein CBR_g16898 [Chara braunii]|uniref:LRAT domain-containing protein n=1 Tax=Chara braunii TaxID=69332 RepID=A0A388KU14_CHABU|nr:hypothetical protein CBR_g16898 [Chara braunii]|eukprot:GBG73555.1 hypothetical protein CBR_g16898 [Chara braunii]
MANLLSNRIAETDLIAGDHIYSWRKGYTYAHHGIFVGDGQVIHFTNGDEEAAFGSSWSSPFSGISGSAMAAQPVAEYEECPACREAFSSGIKEGNSVIKTCLSCFLKGGNLYRCQYGVNPAFFLANVRGGTCTMAATDSPEEVVQRARYLLEHGFGDYNLMNRNCEDFAIYCKTGLQASSGVGISGQASYAATTAKALDQGTSSILTSGFSIPVALTLGVCKGFALYLMDRYASDPGARKDVNRVDPEELVSQLRRRKGRPSTAAEPQTTS